ncbi:MAG: hypothetical protein QOI69_1844, partial [Pseudonocardiales bacterium]|nr:hypothetical protein [Pseudonocardiales bacterium]
SDLARMLGSLIGNPGSEHSRDVNDEEDATI